MNCNTYMKLTGLMAAAVLATTAVSAQDEVRSSSSIYLSAFKKADVTVAFDIKGEGKRYEPTWGLDQAWISEQNMKKGINHMGKENVGIGRSAFCYTNVLTNDSVLGSDDLRVLRQRNSNLNLASVTLPIVLTADQGAFETITPDEYYVKNNMANNEHWAAMINSHVHWLQQNTKHPVVGISPFNEGDYWSREEGGSPLKQWQVAKLLKENYPRCADVAMVGGNTLNNDKALSWYTPGKQYYDWGNTHQLAGSFDTFAGFFQQLQKDGKVGYADEMHNVGEAMIGLEYGMTVGIWWGFDSRARGEFCQISRQGERLAYGEHRNNWTAASVYRHDDGRVKAFIGSSERQALTTNYQLVSTNREVYYDGYGPVREYLTQMNGGTGYQKGQTNAERVIDVTWGEDVAPGVLDGVYKIVNKKSGNVVSYNANRGYILQQKSVATNKRQQWTVKPCTKRSGGDLSFLDIESVDNSNIRINVRDFSTTTGSDIIAWTQDLPSSNEQWYVEYAGNGYYYIRNRESALYMAAGGDGATARIIQSSMLPESTRDRMLFRFLPVDVNYETTAPVQPTGLTAEALTAAVSLKWTPNTEEDLEGYMVLRAPKGTEDWNTIARKLTTTQFTDNTCQPGTAYIYKVKAIDRAQNLSEASEAVESLPTGERSLVARWRMEDNLWDDTENMMDAAYEGTPTFVDGGKSGAKALRLTNSSGKYVQLPYEVASTDELTIAMWVFLRNSSQWQRLFDFGNDTGHYMFLTPNNSYTNVMRFAIKNGGTEQTVDCKTRLVTQQWKHVAVTIGREKTTIYVDGVEAGSGTGISISPRDLHPVMNYLGRSQFAADPLLTADIDDVRIYNYALNGDEVKSVMDDTVDTAVRDLHVDTASSQVYGVDGVKRAAPRRGLNIVDGKKVIR